MPLAQAEQTLQACRVRSGGVKGATALKPTFANIARVAGVGAATVERVLNGRGGVSPPLIERVLAAARALDYPRRLPDMHRGVRRIDVILVRPETTFFARLSASFERIPATLDPTISVHRTFVSEDDPQAVASIIATPLHRRAALIVAVPDHPAVRAALAKLRQSDLPLVQVVTRSPLLDAPYVGIDNYAAGRSAAHFLTRMHADKVGTVLAICHSGIYHVHRERIRGFSEYLAQKGRPEHRFELVLFGRDEGPLTAELLHDALSRFPDTVGLYNAGGANSSICAVLRRHPRGSEIFFVGHQLTERSAEALRRGVMAVVLDQVPEEQARRAMDLTLHRLGLIVETVDNPPIPFLTVTAENL